MRAVKIRAVQDNRRLKHTIADLLRRGLAEERTVASLLVERRLELLLAHPARADEILPESEARDRSP